MTRRRDVAPGWRGALVGAVGCAALAAPAAVAHVTVTPPSVEASVPSEIRLVVPNERAGHATTSLVVELPHGLALVSATPPDGWDVRTDGRRATWSGGRIAGQDSVTFALEVEAGPPARRVELLARQRYDDGAPVTWTPALLVLPAPAGAAPQEHLARAVVAGVIGLVVVAATLGTLRRLRRKAPDG